MGDETDELTKPFRLRAGHWILLAAVVFVGLYVLAVLVMGWRREVYNTRCGSNLNQIGRACYMYADAHDGKFPDRMSALYPTYISDTKVFTCPVRGVRRLEPERIDEEADYVLLPGTTAADSMGTLAYCRHPHPDGTACVLIGAGTVESMTQEELQALLKSAAKEP